MDEEIKTQRKQWRKPELIVLARSKPEEAVLAACKLFTSTGSVTTNATIDCVQPSGCSACASFVGT